jgi:hypothetical protein
MNSCFVGRAVELQAKCKTLDVEAGTFVRVWPCVPFKVSPIKVLQIAEH